MTTKREALAPPRSIRLTGEQHAWIESERERTGDSFGTVVRRCVRHCMEARARVDARIHRSSLHPIPVTKMEKV